jgi:hypothetical protein
LFLERKLPHAKKQIKIGYIIKNFFSNLLACVFISLLMMASALEATEEVFGSSMSEEVIGSKS